MARRFPAILLTILLLALSIGVLVGCGSGNGEGDTASATESAVDLAYKQMREERGTLDSVDEKLAVTKAFLRDYPQSGHTADAVYAVFYYQGEELGDMPGAVSYAEGIRAGITDPEIARSVDKELLGFYSESGMTAKMVTLAEKLAAAGALDFNDCSNVIEGAVKASDWALVRDYCARARPMAAAEAIRAENPDQEYTDEELAKIADERLGMLMVKEGWARANQGQTKEALADFAEADKLVPHYYFDVPEYDLDVYWGNTLMMRGDFEAAVEKFATDGLIMRNEASLDGLKKAYVGMYGSESGFDAYADALHRRVAPTAFDFEMPGYDGRRYRFADLRDNVTLLALWFPT
ncbi:MAG: hypothetical protein P8181_09775 [bacterium]